MMELARLTFPAVGAVLVIALGAYVAGYRRQFIRIAELTEIAPAEGESPRLGGSRLPGRLLRTPFQLGGFSFIWKTLQRSEAHRLVMTAVAGLGLVLSSQALMEAAQNATSARQAALSADALSIPFILTFLIIAGLRLVFEIPVELRANWLFQLMIHPDQRECEGLARNVILIFVLPGVLFLVFPVYAYLEGLLVAGLHTLLIAVWAVLLTNILLVRFRKLPFTCTLPLFKQHSIVIFISFCFGFLIYALSTPEFESSALRQPAHLLALVPVAGVAWFIPHQLAKSTPEIDRKVIFEESASRTIEVLQLGD